jgi:hypothetical protein
MIQSVVEWLGYFNLFTTVSPETAEEMIMIPVEVMTMAGGAAMGHLFKMMSAAQEAKREQQKLQLEMLRGKQEVAAADRESASKSADAAAARASDPFTKLTRRIFVLSVVLMVMIYLIAPFFGMSIAVPVEVQKGFNFLGIIDTTKTVTEYVTLNSMVSFQEIWITFLAAGSFYLGKS